MNTSSKRNEKSELDPRRESHQPAPPNQPPAMASVETQYDELSRSENIVEHLSVAGFLRRIPHRWHMMDINRYGDAVGKAAESLHIAYLTRIDLSLGYVRIFPLPLMKRVYDTQARLFGWPQIIDAPGALDDGPRGQLRTLRRHERVEKHLSALVEGLESPEVKESMEKVLHFVMEDARRLRKELGLAETESDEAA